jgi:hypothetical protein
VEVASALKWIPSVGATPTFSAVGQIAPIKASPRVYLSGGLGVITGHSTNGDRLKGRMQGVLAVRAPLHEIAPFVQLGGHSAAAEGGVSVRDRAPAGAVQISPALRVGLVGGKAVRRSVKMSNGRAPNSEPSRSSHH